MAKYVLITNLEWVTVGPVRTFTHALLLEEYPHMFDPKQLHRRIRGFGTEAAWPVFDLDTPSIAYKMIDAKGKDIFIGDDGKQRPLTSGAILQVEGGPRVALIVADYEQPIDVEVFEGPDDVENNLIGRVWGALETKVPRYWRPPFMPTLVWGRPNGRAVRRG